MTSDRSILERQMDGVELRPFTLDEFHRRRQRKQRNRRTTTTVMGLVLAAAALGGVLWSATSDTDQETITSDDVAGPGLQPPGPYVGTWESTDTDGSFQTMEIQRTASGEHEMVTRDDAATACAGAPATLTGTGRVQTDGALVVTSELTCDDGSTPLPLSDPEMAGEFLDLLAHLTFTYDSETDALVDSLEVTWRRPGSDGSPLGPPEVIRRMVDAVNARDPDSFRAAFAADGSFAPRGDFGEPSTELGGDVQPASDSEGLQRWLGIQDAWGLEANVISCTRVGRPGSTVGEDIDSVLACEVATQWHTLSMEIIETWYFEMRNEGPFAELVWWNSMSCCRNELDLLDLDPAGRRLPLGYSDLEAWEGWLQSNHPDDAARFLNPRARVGDCDGCVQADATLAPTDPARASRLTPLVVNAQDDWVIDGDRFTPVGLIPYDPAFADEIEASIQEYMEAQ